MAKKREDLLPILQSGLIALDLKLDQAVQEKILAYISLLHKWNKTYNLTAIRHTKEILIRHIFDSLAIVPFITGPDVLDFGSGGGLPGIPLALALPEYNFILLDSSNKKTIFLNHVVLSLKIENVKVVTSRIEEFSFSSGFATIVTRATNALGKIVNETNRLCAKKGQILAMKGKYPKEELETIVDPQEVYNIEVPYLDEERHLVKVVPKD